MEEVYDWQLTDSVSETFTIHEPHTTWHRLPGVYIFAYKDGEQWRPVYIGKTDEFSTRITNREHWEAAVLLGATHIHTQLEVLDSKRVFMHRQLIRRYQPALNAQLG